ncbi:MAG: hypothetical protein FWB80_13575 [Defluviitaleaceae bacterium]|nr:hypothetical protein [Defluviitaleaceae bacterium]
MKKILLLLTLIALSLALTACGRNRTTDENDVSGQTPQGGTGNGLGGIPDPLSQRPEFTVFTPTGNVNSHIQNAVRARMSASGSYEYNVVTYLFEERVGFQEQMLGMFAAGPDFAPDIFVVDSMLLYPLIEGGFLANIYDLFAHANEYPLGRFFQNALASHEIGGRLYALPMHFGFEFIGINATLPDEFLERFAMLSYASPAALMQIYADLVYAYPEYADFYFANFFPPNAAFTPELTDMVDFAAGTVSFPTGMADFMEQMRDVMLDNSSFAFGPSTDEFIYELQANHVFHVGSGLGSAIDALFDFQNAFFINYLPIADNSGRLVNRAGDWNLPTIAVSANANPAEAWAFIEEIIAATNSGLSFDGTVHTVEMYALDFIERGLSTALTQFEGRPIHGSESAAVSSAAGRILAYAQRPVNHPITRLFLPMEAFARHLSDFLNGETEAEEAIAQMEASITEWLNTEREITPYVPTVIVEDHRPQRTLTVRIPDRHTGVFLQAAEAMDAEWQARGEEYGFSLILEDHDWADWEGMQTRIERLNTELMTGQGPDILIYESGINIRPFARSGFLTDINVLIENCPNTSRGEFFEHVLDAFEFDGGLYMLPVSFGFYYVGINAELPQATTPRTTITPSEIYEIFLQNVGEFPHLNAGVSWSIGDLHSAIDIGLGGFIDFSTRTANFTHPDFIEYLNMLSEIFISQERQSLASGWMATAPSQGFMNDRAREQMFEMGNSGLMGISSFFELETPVFLNYSILTDRQGRALINPNGDPIWAKLLFPTAGNSELAWEFTRHLLQAYYAPTGRALVEPRWGSPTPWNTMSIATPITRAHFPSKPRLAFEHVSNFGELGLADPDVAAAIRQLTPQMDMPVTLTTTFIPSEVWAGSEFINLGNFMEGALTAEAFAQQIQNSISLWLME